MGNVGSIIESKTNKKMETDESAWYQVLNLGWLQLNSLNGLRKWHACLHHVSLSLSL